MTAQEMLEMAIGEVPYLNPGEEFTVKNLFKGYVWKREPIGTRLMLGTLFLNYVEQNREEVEPAGKNKAGQQVYRHK